MRDSHTSIACSLVTTRKIFKVVDDFKIVASKKSPAQVAVIFQIHYLVENRSVSSLYLTPIYSVMQPFSGLPEYSGASCFQLYASSSLNWGKYLCIVDMF